MYKFIAITVWTLMSLVSTVAHAATTITFDDLASSNPNYYRSQDGLYWVDAFGANVNTVDLVHGNPPPALGIPVPYATQTVSDMGLAVTSSTLHQEFQWDELTVLGHPTYGVEYWIHAVDSEQRDIFVLHGIAFGAKVVQTPKSDAEMVQLWVLMTPTNLTNSRVGLYGAVDNIKLRAKGEKAAERCKRKCAK